MMQNVCLHANPKPKLILRDKIRFLGLDGFGSGSNLQ